MFAKYIIRLDDASPTMSREKWERMEKLLDDYGIKPIVAVVPNNKDENLMVDRVDDDFWNRVKMWQKRGWEIALHGYEHKYVTEAESLVPINNYSEFAGVSLEEQQRKISEGIAIFREHEITTRLWVAPAHSFDENTIKALKSESDITIISDGIAFSTYWEYGMHWVPQQLWKFRAMPFGTWTTCFHPDTMSDKDFNRLEVFLEKHGSQFVTMDSLTFKKRGKNILEHQFENSYWKMLAKKKAKKRVAHAQ
jgi:predicted deacetylase